MPPEAGRAPRLPAGGNDSDGVGEASGDHPQAAAAVSTGWGRCPGVAPVLQSSGIENFRPRDAANDPNTSLTQVLTSEKYGRIDSPQPTESGTGSSSL
ncbi:hypothetical protein Y1Q_0001633 [Alligator mississippiensis]|uniref:Uncharacterized protein n=1 Tax=Alligator mississippiensis TaxID=8496 RepID=A0A151MA66_ALLMI|nr:hypothetical protein Y1Q_0001633 [Alligator mississippiensis]